MRDPEEELMGTITILIGNKRDLLRDLWMTWVLSEMICTFVD